MTVGLKHTSVDAVGWAADRAHTVLSSGHILTTNSGFGGINAAVVLSLASDVSLSPVDVGEKKTMCVSGRGCARAGLAVPEIVPFSLHRNFGRFSAEARLAFYAIAQALRDAHLNPMAAGTRVGIIAVDHDGCAAANRVYFSDYVQSGRVLGRGQLFVYTLPTSVAAECAIACHLVGPLCM